ncbi:MAG: ABC transporter ATP-binding protein [Deltaproteobacteria bacterium]|nr:ABC transporter ATP-binding protein [Deltaproteobacteria bacterium]
MKKNLKKSIVLKALYQYKWYVLITIVVNFTGHFFLCYSTVIFKNLIDSIESLSHLNEIVPVVAFFILLNLLEITLSYLDEYPFRVLDTGLYQWAKVQAIKKISYIDYQSYNTLGTGNLIQRIENGATAVKDISFFYLRILTELLPAVLLNLFFIAYFDGFIFKIIIGVYMIIFITSFFLLKYLKAHQEKILTL